MNNEYVSTKQGICTVILFLLGSSLVVGINTASGQDSWLSFLVSVALILPVLFIYCRILKLYPEKDIFDISKEVLGKVFSKIVIILLSIYALHLGAVVIRDFTEFFQEVELQETPQLPLMIIFSLVTVYIVKSGVEVLGKWSVFVLPIVIFMVIVTIVFALPIMDFSNILPVGGHGIKKIFYGSLNTFGFPLGETIMFLMIANVKRKNSSPYKLYFYGILFGGLILTLAILRNIFILGKVNVAESYYPSYLAARIINIGNFLTRIEVTISANFLLGGITKVTVCLFALAKGTQKLFGLKNYRVLVAPLGLLMVALCDILFSSTIEMFSFNDIYFYYAFPFQVIIPVIIWIAAEIKSRKKKA